MDVRGTHTRAGHRQRVAALVAGALFSVLPIGGLAAPSDGPLEALTGLLAKDQYSTLIGRSAASEAARVLKERPDLADDVATLLANYARRHITAWDKENGDRSGDVADALSQAYAAAPAQGRTLGTLAAGAVDRLAQTQRFGDAERFGRRATGLVEGLPGEVGGTLRASLAAASLTALAAAESSAATVLMNAALVALPPDAAEAFLLPRAPALVQAFAASFAQRPFAAYAVIRDVAAAHPIPRAVRDPVCGIVVEAARRKADEGKVSGGLLGFGTTDMMAWSRELRCLTDLELVREYEGVFAKAVAAQRPSDAVVALKEIRAKREGQSWSIDDAPVRVALQAVADAARGDAAAAKPLHTVVDALVAGNAPLAVGVAERLLREAWADGEAAYTATLETIAGTDLAKLAGDLVLEDGLRRTRDLLVDERYRAALLIADRYVATARGDAREMAEVSRLAVDGLLAQTPETAADAYATVHSVLSTRWFSALDATFLDAFYAEGGDRTIPFKEALDEDDTIFAYLDSGRVLSNARGIMLTSSKLVWHNLLGATRAVRYEDIQSVQLVYEKSVTSLTGWVCRVNGAEDLEIRLSRVDDGGVLPFVDLIAYLAALGGKEVEVRVGEQELAILGGALWLRHQDVLILAASLAAEVGAGALGGGGGAVGGVVKDGLKHFLVATPRTAALAARAGRMSVAAAGLAARAGRIAAQAGARSSVARNALVLTWRNAPVRLGGETIGRAKDFYSKDKAIRMPFVGRGQANANTLGFLRSSREYWRRYAERYPGDLSEANRALIATGRSPVVDKAWVAAYPTHARFMGQTLEHHHLAHGPNAVPLPWQLHDANEVWHVE